MKILIGGDYVPCENIAQKMEAGDFSYFDEIKPLTAQADLSIINLEAPIVESEASPIEKCGPNLKTTAKVIESLKYANINMVTLANNHIMDFGEKGLKDTLRALHNGGIESVGVGENLANASHIKYVTIDGKTLAIINACEHEFSIATSDKPGANPLNPIQQYYSITEARKNADYVLIIIHGGHEHWQLPSPRMVETYRFFIDSGADAVVNHHQHCYSGYEFYHGKPIFYGLGNLCFPSSNRHDSPWNFGYLLSLDFGHVLNYTLHPYSQCNGNSTIRLLPDNPFQDKLAELNAIIANSNELKKVTAEYYSSCRKQIHQIFSPYSGRILSKLFLMGLLPSFLKNKKLQCVRNYLNCESHRDKVSFNI